MFVARALFAGFALVAMLLLAGCFDDDGEGNPTSSPSPSATQTATPTATPTASVTPTASPSVTVPAPMTPPVETSIETVDALVAAVLSRDPEAIHDAFDFQPVPCDDRNEPGAIGPRCLEGEEQGTLVGAILRASCSAGYRREEDMGARFALIASLPYSLNAIYEETDAFPAPTSYVALFALDAGDANEPVPEALAISVGPMGAVAIQEWCNNRLLPPLEGTTFLFGPLVEGSDLPTDPRSARPERPWPDTVVPFWIEGLATNVYCGVDGRRSYAAEYPVVPGLEPLTDALDAAVRSQIGYLDPGIRPTEGSAASECTAGFSSESVSIEAKFLVASGDVVGVQLRRFWVGASGHISYTTIWFDLRTQQLLRAVDLLDGDEAMADLSTLALVALDERRAAEDAGRGRGPTQHPPGIEDRIQPTHENFDTLGFDRRGRLIVTFDEGQVGYGTEGPIPIAIERAVVEPLLSDFGRRVLAETLSPSDALRLEARVTP